jgi:catechol 2,3-dioxygenase-like lactoylglutathione lyase family enzyme
MSEPRVTRLRHVGVGVQDYDKQVEFYEGLWGLRKVDADTGVSFFATEGSPENYVLRVRSSDVNRVDLIAFGVDSAEDVDALAGRLAAEGVTFASEPGRLQTPGGGYGFRFFDPDGRVIEVSSDVEERSFRVLEPRESVPNKLSHVVVYTPDPAGVMQFYQDKLGFRLSGWIQDFFGFLRCTPDFHTLAIVKGPNANLHHISFEMRGFDEYMYGVGRLVENGVPMTSGLGKHTPTDGGFAYFIDPNGNTSEYAAPQEMIVDEEGYKPRLFGSPAYPDQPGLVRAPYKRDDWGTSVSRNMPEDPTVGNRSEADPGLWVAPPV